MRDAIKQCSNECRQFVKEGFKKNIDLLRMEQKPYSNKNYDDIIKRMPKNYAQSSK
jgi:hypothetical protein